MSRPTKPLIAISTSTFTGDDAEHCSTSVERAGGEPWLITPGNGLSPDEILSKVSGLLITGGEDIHPSWYGQNPEPDAHVRALPARDEFEQPLLRAALNADYPVLCICRGFQALNVAMGGTLIQHLEGHRTEKEEGQDEGFVFHRIFITPGSKLTSILGIGGFVRVNSWHHQGIREANRAAGLITSAYSLDDGLVEGLESHNHDWVVGVQCHPETPGGVPPYFENLFKGFVERAARRLSTNPPP